MSSVAVYRVTDALFSNVTNIRMYFDIGLPSGDLSMFNKGVLLTPKFVGLLSNQGSPGGSTIVLNV
jgi:hypothetical protein